MIEKLLNLIYDSDPISNDGSGYVDYVKIADHLIANGVTFAEDNNVPCKKPMTNGDRIRAMSDEELAEFNISCPFIDEECTMKGCYACILEWLKQPCEVRT